MLRLMEEIPNNHLVWSKNSVNSGINYYPGGVTVFCKRLSHVIPKPKLSTNWHRRMTQGPKAWDKQDH